MSVADFKLGKLPKRNVPALPKMSAYAKALAPPPATASWLDNVATWPMDMNDTIGDCTCAALSHMVQCWTTNEGNPVVFTDAQVLSLYETLSGYTPGNPATDTGCVVLDVINYWQKTGVYGHTLTAFAGVDITNTIEIKQAISLFGGVYVGLGLPITAQAQTGPGLVWDIEPGANGAFWSWGGHAVCILGYDATGLTCITWGQVQKMTWAFFEAYIDEAYACISQDFLNAQGVDPAGVSLAQLQADLASISVVVPGASTAFVSFTDGAEPSGATGALIAPSLVLAAPGAMEVDAVVGYEGANRTVTAVKNFPDFSLGVLSAPLNSDWYFGYTPNWAGGVATIAGSVGHPWFANQAFNGTPPALTTTPLAGSMGSPVFQSLAIGAQLVGIMTTNGTCTVFNSADIAQIQSAILISTGLAPAIGSLYVALLGRTPDPGGFAYWSGRYKASAAELGTAPTSTAVLLSDQTIIQGFLSSPEFTGLNSGYQAADPTEFVTYLYQACLGRAPDAGGLAYWCQQITSKALTYIQVIVEISQSDEGIGYMSAQVTI